VGDRGVDVVDVEREVVAADVAVLRRHVVLVWGPVFEELEVRAVAAAQKT